MSLWLVVAAVALLLLVFVAFCYSVAQRSVSVARGKVLRDPDDSATFISAIALEGALWTFLIIGFLFGSSDLDTHGIFFIAIITTMISAILGGFAAIYVVQLIIRLHYPGTTFKEGESGFSKTIVHLGARRKFRSGWTTNLLQ
jgi:hypothetical protein